MVRRVSILGATGSIGQSTIDLIRRDRGAYQVVALSGAQNIAQLATDAVDLRAEVAVTADSARLDDLRAALEGSGVEAAAGATALIEAAARPADWIMSAIVGVAGLAPGFEALKQGTVLALANKESLVCAGKLLLETAAVHGTRILPVDSEHSAIFQALIGEDIASVERIIITASGGALRDWPLDKLNTATLEQTLAHPNWAMGQRITVDSASMFNKAMEVIETREFFKVAPEKIEVIVHPQSLIHALVGYCDGALMAHVGPADMRHAIGYALHYPERANLPVDRLDLAAIGQLDFRAPDETRWPALRLARETMAAGGMTGAAFNAGKEAALDGFIAGQIGFMQMSDVVAQVLEDMGEHKCLIDATMTLDNVAQVDHLARQAAQVAIQNRAG